MLYESFQNDSFESPCTFVVCVCWGGGGGGGGGEGDEPKFENKKCSLLSVLTLQRHINTLWLSSKPLS